MRDGAWPRRSFLLNRSQPPGAIAALPGYNSAMQSRRTAGERGRDTVEASATDHSTARVGIILSSFAGGEDHFGGTKFAPLDEPRPVNAELPPAQVRQMTLRAIELGNAEGGLPRKIQRQDEVVLLASRDADPVVVATVLEEVTKRQPKKVMLVSTMKNPPSGVDVIDPATAESMTMPAPGIFSRKNVTYRVPVAVLHCERLIAIAPLRITMGRPSLTIDLFRDVAKPTSPAAGGADLVALDAFGFKVPDYAVLGGTLVFRDGKPLRHNLVIASTSAVAADAVGAAILGFKPAAVPLLTLARKRGYGDPDLDVIWMRGNEVSDAAIKPASV